MTVFKAHWPCPDCNELVEVTLEGSMEPVLDEEGNSRGIEFDATETPESVARRAKHLSDHGIDVTINHRASTS